MYTKLECSSPLNLSSIFSLVCCWDFFVEDGIRMTLYFKTKCILVSSRLRSTVLTHSSPFYLLSMPQCLFTSARFFPPGRKHQLTPQTEHLTPSPCAASSFYLLPSLFFLPFLPRGTGATKNHTSFLLIFEMPPIAFWWVIATIGHSFFKSRLNSMYSSELLEQDNIRQRSEFKEKVQYKFL